MNVPSGASDKDIANAFFNSEITVMIGGILAGGFISFGVFLVVGFVCVKIKNRRPQQNQTQNQHNLNHQQNNHCNLNGSANSNGVAPGNGNKALLQVSVFFFHFLSASNVHWDEHYETEIVLNSNLMIPDFPHM